MTARTRVGSGRDRVEDAPLDARRHRPRRQDSDRFPQGLGALVRADAPAEALTTLQTIVGRGVSVTASEDLHREPARDGEPDPNHRPVPGPTAEAPLPGVTADGNGVPWVRSARGPDVANGAAVRTDSPAASPHRRGQGATVHPKRMAAVGAVDTIEPWVRTADEVVDEVLRTKAAGRRPRPAHQRVRAALLVGKVAWFLGLADEVHRRNPPGLKPLIFRSDGERAVHDRQGEYVPEKVVWILDRFHVLERLGKVAWCLHRGVDPEAGGAAVGGGAAADAAGREGR